jgi:hypothetical protein
MKSVSIRVDVSTTFNDAAIFGDRGFRFELRDKLQGSSSWTGSHFIATSAVTAFEREFLQ